ncbi:MAG: DsbA family protein [Candidatus Methylacidiphilales bacterium]
MIIFILIGNGLITFAQKNKNNKEIKVNMDTVKMKIEIWSDVMCPFCYIGKRKFENALAKFSDKNYIEVEWKSFELNPSLKTDTTKTLAKYLAEQKRLPMEQVNQMINHASNMAKQVGLDYKLETAIVANSFNAHRFSHYAKSKGKQLEAEEVLFKAYFILNKNTDDTAILMELGTEIGLNANELKVVLESNQFANEVRADENEAVNLGIQGVPFFVFNRKSAVSGAQDESVFLNALQKNYAEFRKNNPIQKFDIIEGAVCKPDGNCE